MVLYKSIENKMRDKKCDEYTFNEILKKTGYLYQV